MISKKIIKIKSLLRQNIVALSIVILWFLINYIIFIIMLEDVLEPLLIVLFLRENESLYGHFYSMYTDFIIFGILFSLITIELFRKYNPEDTCRKFAKHFTDHAIIIGYNHIGQRIAEYFDNIGKKYVVIELDGDKVQSLIDDEEAVIHDDVILEQTLKDAGIENAKAVYVLIDDLDVQIVVNHNIRKKNKECKLILRIYENEIAEIFQNLYYAQIISTSNNAANYILDNIEIKNYKNILIIGINHITARIINRVSEFLPCIKFLIIEENMDKAENLLMIDSNSINIKIMNADPKELNLLKEISLKDIDCVINMNPDISTCLLLTKRIRDVNSECKIINRFFLDNVAPIIEKPPFNSEVISSSKFTLEYMKKRDMLKF